MNWNQLRERVVHANWKHWAPVLIGLALAGGMLYAKLRQEPADTLLARISAEAKSAAAKHPEITKALTEHPELWEKKEWAASEYLAQLRDDKLAIIGLRGGATSPGIPTVMFVTRDGVLGYAVDTWRGTLAERALTDKAGGPEVVMLKGAQGGGVELKTILVVCIELLLVGMLLFMMRDSLPGAGGGRFALVKDVDTDFDDVIGATEAKAALQDVVDYLADPDSYTKLGARPSRGVLLSGPPGTGKTLLAKALAGECGVSFIACSGADFSSKFYGVGIQLVKNLFKKARAERACIVFIDEIDGIGQRVNSGEGAGATEGNRIINQILIELDGFAEDSRVIVIGATNLLDNVDPALKREGRFDRKIVLQLPNLAEREALLRLYCDGLTIADSINYALLSRMTIGLAPAAIASLANQAALLAARDNARAVDMPHMAEAIETIRMGAPSSAVLTTDERQRTAVHEAGHALVALLRESGNVEKVTILPRGMALGVTLITPLEDLRMHTRTALLHRLDVLLAGRCAEELVLGDVSSGAGNDLEQATALASDFLTKLGMGSTLATLSREQASGPEMLQQLDSLLQERYGHVRDVLTQHRDTLEAITAQLLESETIDGEALQQIVRPRLLQEAA